MFGAVVHASEAWGSGRRQPIGKLCEQKNEILSMVPESESADEATGIPASNGAGGL